MEDVDVKDEETSSFLKRLPAKPLFGANWSMKEVSNHCLIG